MNRTMALTMEASDGDGTGGNALLPVFLQPASEAAAELGVDESDAIFLGLDSEGAPVFAFGIEEEAGLRFPFAASVFLLPPPIVFPVTPFPSMPSLCAPVVLDSCCAVPIPNPFCTRGRTDCLPYSRDEAHKALSQTLSQLSVLPPPRYPLCVLWAESPRLQMFTASAHPCASQGIRPLPILEQSGSMSGSPAAFWTAPQQRY